MRHRFPALATFLLCCTAATTGWAHTVTIDGLANDWMTRQPNTVDLGMVLRDANGTGELVWRDATLDARTLVSDPENEADMKIFRVTGDADNLYFLVGLPNTHSTTPVQVQIAIDFGLAGAISTFLSGSETQLSTGGQANFVVRTAFTNPFVATAGAQVSNKNQTVLSSVPTQFGADGIEIAVPWTTFQLNGPPTDRVRFHVATFRAQTATSTVEVAGADALDVLSDYGDPRGVVQGPGTDAELADDNRVDDFIDAYFADTGEVYSPVVVSRFVSNGLAPGNWIVLKNLTAASLSAQQLRLGDSEVPDDGEGMFTLPIGTIASKAEYVVAANGTNYQNYFGQAPNAEITDSSATVPNGVSFAPWADGAFVLATAGDEIILLDGTNTILDVVPYGTGAFVGVNGFKPTPGVDVVVGRAANLADTDDCAVDFSALGGQCANSATCGTCKVCSQQACSNAAAGTSCADNDVCNGNETCDGKGICSAAGAPKCDDKDPCTSDSCHPVNGCLHASAPAGTSCNDKDSCTTTDACNGAGACQGSALDCTPPAPSCASKTKSVKYTDGLCNSGACEFTSVETACPNGCDPLSGLCKGDPCEGLDCGDPPSQCQYFSGICKQGLCNYDAKEPGSTCDDGDPCTVLDACNGGQECNGIPVQCNAAPTPSCVASDTSRTYAAIGECKAGSCSYEFSDQKCGAGCSDRTGLCLNDPCGEVSCDSPPGKCYANIGTCSDGQCSYEARPLLSVCDDGNACTTEDSCDGRGTCAGAADPACADPCEGVVCDAPPGDCYEATGSCADGVCDYAPLADCGLGEGGSAGSGNEPGNEAGAPNNAESGAAGAEATMPMTGEGGSPSTDTTPDEFAGASGEQDASSSTDPAGCSCRTTGQGSSGPGGALLLLGALWGLTARRARRS